MFINRIYSYSYNKGFIYDLESVRDFVETFQGVIYNNINTDVKNNLGNKLSLLFFENLLKANKEVIYQNKKPLLDP